MKKVKDPELAKNIWLSAYGILGGCASFYIALGAYIGQNYQVADPAVQEEIDDIGKLIVEEKVFPLVAKVRALAEISGFGGVIPIRVESPGRAGQTKKKPVAEGGFLTSEQAAKKLNVSKEWLLRKAKCGIAPHVRIGGVIRFSEKKINDWINGHEIKGALKI